MTTKHTYFIYVAAMIIGIAASGFHCSAQKIDLLLNLNEVLWNSASAGIYLDHQLDTIFQVKYDKDSSEFIEWHTQNDEIIKLEPIYDTRFIGGETAQYNFARKYYLDIVKGKDFLFLHKMICFVLLDRNLDVMEARVFGGYLPDNHKEVYAQLDSAFVKIGYESEGHWELIGRQHRSKRQKYHIGIIFQQIH